VHTSRRMAEAEFPSLGPVSDIVAMTFCGARARVHLQDKYPLIIHNDKAAFLTIQQSLQTISHVICAYTICR
jgi:hypothetical protein